MNNLPLTEMTLRQLRRVASVLGISRYSRMRKDQLLDSIVSRQGVVDAPQAAEAQAIDQQQPTIANPSPTTNSTMSIESAASPEAPVTASVATTTTTITKRPITTTDLSLADVDADLPDLPGGYGDSRIVLLPRDPQWAYAYWDISNEHKQELRNQGGQTLALRVYDVTDIDVHNQAPHNLQEYGCDEMAREWYMPIPVSDRDYMIEIGYRTWDGRWLMLARSAPMRVPPVYPSDWVEDHFVTVGWDTDLRGKQVMTLVPPSQKSIQAGAAGMHESVFGLAADAEAMRIAGSLYGSMQHMAGSMQMLPMESLSSYIFPSGVGMWAMPTASGLNMSGVGFGASMPPERPRQFWLVADAELIVYGATEPDATVYIDGEPIELSPDGTFRFQMSFQDGELRFPILAVAKDGEQTRAVRMEFERQTHDRRTNTKEEAVLEWLPN
jgi:hypothetical protein